MTDNQIAQAGNIANVIVAFANMILVLFLFWQIILQKRFFRDQALRDAAQKISESYQRLTSAVMTSEDLAGIFYQTHDPAHGRRRAVWNFALSTLHHEHRFVRQGLHPLDNLKRTAQVYIGFITDPKLLLELKISALNSGFDKDFTNIIEEIIGKRLRELGRENYDRAKH